MGIRIPRANRKSRSMGASVSTCSQSEPFMKSSLAAADKALLAAVLSLAVLATGCSDRSTGDARDVSEQPTRLSNAGQMGESHVPLEPSADSDLPSAGRLSRVAKQEPAPSTAPLASSKESPEKRPAETTFPPAGGGQVGHSAPDQPRAAEKI